MNTIINQATSTVKDSSGDAPFICINTDGHIQVGMKVQHKVTGEVMTVKKVFGSVVTCNTENHRLTDTLIVDSAVCLKDNLVLINQTQPA